MEQHASRIAVARYKVAQSVRAGVFSSFQRAVAS
jgi:hypothetical protein